MDDEREDEEKEFDDFPGSKGKSKGPAFDDDDPVDVDDEEVSTDLVSLDAEADKEDEEGEEFDEYDDSYSI